MCLIRPHVGWIMKCNVDGVFYEDQWHGAIDAIMRNDAGFFEEGRALWYEHCLDALTMEALVCRDGLSWRSKLQACVQKVWLEMNCQDLVRSVE